MTTTETVASLRAAYEQANAARLAYSQRHSDWRDEDIPSEDRAELRRLSDSSAEAARCVLAAQISYAVERGFSVAGTIATCPRCNARGHVEIALSHTCNARAAAAVAAEQAQTARVQTAQTAGYRVISARYAGTCVTCGQRFATGTQIAYAAGEAQHLGCVGQASGERTCRYCGERESSGFGGVLCPMSRDGEQPHRWQ